jgi:hypothetical protein
LYSSFPHNFANFRVQRYKIITNLIIFIFFLFKTVFLFLQRFFTDFCILNLERYISIAKINCLFKWIVISDSFPAISKAVPWSGEVLLIQSCCIINSISKDNVLKELILDHDRLLLLHRIYHIDQKTICQKDQKLMFLYQIFFNVGFNISYLLYQ